jgi:hypothetical protein
LFIFLSIAFGTSVKCNIPAIKVHAAALYNKIIFFVNMIATLCTIYYKRKSNLCYLTYFIDIREKLAATTLYTVTIDIIYFDTIMYSSHRTRGLSLKEFNNRFNGGRRHDTRFHPFTVIID